MADMDLVTSVEHRFSKEGTFSAGDRLVIVKNPTVEPGGTIIYDKTVPAGKEFKGRLQIYGDVKTV